MLLEAIFFQGEYAANALKLLGVGPALGEVLQRKSNRADPIIGVIVNFALCLTNRLAGLPSIPHGNLTVVIASLTSFCLTARKLIPTLKFFLHETFAESRIEFLQSAEIYLLSCTDVSVGQTKDFTTTTKIS
jgi:hypothetical protein